MTEIFSIGDRVLVSSGDDSTVEVEIVNVTMCFGTPFYRYLCPGGAIATSELSKAKLVEKKLRKSCLSFFEALSILLDGGKVRRGPDGDVLFMSGTLLLDSEYESYQNLNGVDILAEDWEEVV